MKLVYAVPELGTISSIKLTMDTYGHLFDGADLESAAKMERLFAPDRKVVQMAKRKAP